MLAALDDFMLKLLLICAMVSVAVEVAFAEPELRSHGKLIILLTNIAWIEGTAMFIAVIVVAFVGSYNDYQKEL